VVELARRVPDVVTAHIAGVPVEELVIPWLGGLSAGLLLARTWVVARVGRVKRRE
jgi:hypothetical protein